MAPFPGSTSAIIDPASGTRTCAAPCSPSRSLLGLTPVSCFCGSTAPRRCPPTASSRRRPSRSIGGCWCRGDRREMTRPSSTTHRQARSALVPTSRARMPDPPERAVVCAVRRASRQSRRRRHASDSGGRCVWRRLYAIVDSEAAGLPIDAAGRVVGQTTVGELESISAETDGDAWITGEHTFLVEDEDPLSEGFALL